MEGKSGDTGPGMGMGMMKERKEGWGVMPPMMEK